MAVRLGLICFLCLLASQGEFSNVYSRLQAAEDFPKFQQALQQRGRNVKIVCFGDSVTGVYYHTGGRRAYTALVEIAVRKTKPRAKVTAINAGISGNTTRDALARIQADVLDQKPDLVTIMFGLNDMTRVPIEEYRKNLGEIIRRCREVGAEVLLCTPNSVYDTPGRPTAKLETYVTAVRQVGQTSGVPVADCYASYQGLRSRDEFAWTMLMSDEIHPNLDGHKRIAEEIGQAVLGRRMRLNDVPVSQPAVAAIGEKLKKKQPVHVLAMSPYDEKVKVAIRNRFPTANLRVTPWETAGKSLKQIEEQAKKVRGLKVDLVVIAVPIETTASSEEQYVRTYSWILNYSLSFGRREWDVVAVDPLLADETYEPEQRRRAELIRQLTIAQDLVMIPREANDQSPVDVLLTRWFLKQWPEEEAKPTILKPVSEKTVLR